MLKRRNFLTLLPLALGVLTLAPATHAQQRTTKPGLGFTFVMPEGYGEDDRVNKIRSQKGGPPVALYLTDGGLNHEDDANRTSKTLLTGIYVVADPLRQRRSAGGSVSVKVSGEEEKKSETSNSEIQRLFDNRDKPMTREEKEQVKLEIEKIAKLFLPNRFAYQNGAFITVDGFPAIAILASESNEFSQTEITGRFILIMTKRQTYLTYAGYANSEFESRSKAFMKFVQSIKFIERPEGEKKKTPPAVTTKKKK
jgi:hypothetical protein